LEFEPKIAVTNPCLRDTEIQKTNQTRIQKKNNQKINQKNQKLNLARNQNSKIKTKKIEKTMVSLIVIKIRCSG
jgi:hypothetical protein